MPEHPPQAKPTSEAASASATGPQERHRDLDRLLTFVDAIVAIAITLLVLPLVDIATEVTGSEPVTHVLRAHLAEFGAFVLSFAVIFRMWMAQHGAVRPLLGYHRGIALLLGAWALTIAFLPFPTSLVASVGSQAAVKILYVGTIGLSVLLVGIVEQLIRTNTGLTGGDHLPDPLASAVTLGLVVIALAVMLLVPWTSYVPLVLLVADGPVAHAVRRRWPGRT